MNAFYKKDSGGVRCQPPLFDQRRNSLFYLEIIFIFRNDISIRFYYRVIMNC